MISIVLGVAIPWTVFGVLCLWAIQRGKKEKRRYLLKKQEQQNAERDLRSRQASLFGTPQTSGGEVVAARELVGSGAR